MAKPIRTHFADLDLRTDAERRAPTRWQPRQEGGTTRYHRLCPVENCPESPDLIRNLHLCKWHFLLRRAEFFSKLPIPRFLMAKGNIPWPFQFECAKCPSNGPGRRLYTADQMLYHVGSQETSASWLCVSHMTEEQESAKKRGSARLPGVELFDVLSQLGYSGVLTRREERNLPIRIRIFCPLDGSRSVTTEKLCQVPGCQETPCYTYAYDLCAKHYAQRLIVYSHKRTQTLASEARRKLQGSAQC